MRIKNNLFLIFNFIITLVYLIVTGILIWFMFAYNPPAKLITVTETVEKFRQHEADWLDYLFGDGSSFFRVWLTDGSMYEATGICYDNIDEALFSELAVGDEITIRYEDRGFGGGAGRIYGIEYQGVSYQNTDGALAEMKAEDDRTHIFCPILMAVATVAAGALYFLNFKKNRRKNKKNQTTRFIESDGQ